VINIVNLISNTFMTHALQLLISDMQQFSVDVCCISETWFTSNMNDDYTSVGDYSLFRRDRKKRKGGGVCIYVRESYQSRLFFSSDNFEVIWVKLQLHNDCFFIASCYHLPKPRYCSNDFVKELCSTIDHINDTVPDPVFLITGDFNSLSMVF